MTTPDLGQKTRAETTPSKPVRTWTGVLGLLDTPSVDGRALALPPLGQPDHRGYPLPLLAHTPDADKTVICGSIRRIWRNGNTIRGWGRIEVDPRTSWGQNLLRSNPQPVVLSLREIEGAELNAAWWHPLARALGRSLPKVYTSQVWKVRGALLHQQPSWPDAFITLEQESRS